jgi:hypothetical protein
MAKSRGGKKRCSIGKSCGATCIAKGKVCIKELNGNVSSGASQLKGMLTQGSPPTVKESSPSQPKVPLSVSAKVGSLPASSGNRTEINKSPGLLKAEEEERKRVQREFMKSIAQAGRDADKINEGRLKKREKELAKEFKDKNGRWPNRKGEREKIRDQAWKEQMKEIRDRRKKMEEIKNMKLPYEVLNRLSEERRKRREEKESRNRGRVPLVIQTMGGGPRLTPEGNKALDRADEMIAKGGKDKEEGERLKKFILDQLKPKKSLDWGKFGVG